MRRAFVLPFCLAVLLLPAGCRQRGAAHTHVLGRAPRGEIQTVLSVKAGNTPPNVSIAGVMVEKCPVAGCWFRLRDRTGVIKVDTKTAGFVVTDVPLDRPMTVAGKVVSEGDDVTLEATGVSY